jgi:rRNA maturation protein Rpf1
MDFGTIKENLKKHFYKSMRQFIEDVELVFNNCLVYNGEKSQVSTMCKEVRDEYLK